MDKIYLSTFKKVLTVEKWNAIVSKAIEDAIDGDYRARNFLFNVLIEDIEGNQNIKKITNTDILLKINEVYGIENKSEGNFSKKIKENSFGLFEGLQ